MRSLLFILIAICLACQQQPSKKEFTLNAVAEGQSFNAAFLLIDGVYNSELMAPYDIFQHTIFHTKGGITVFTVAPDSLPKRTFEGLNILPDFTFDSPDLPEIDILVVASAEHNMDSDLENEMLINWVRETGLKADYVMSLCDGAFILAQAGLVKGKESTTFPTDIEKYRQKFPALKVHEEVTFVHDEKLLTSSGGAKSYDVALYLVQHLYGHKVAKGVGKGLVIDWNLEDYQFIRVE
jgi:transcriptional regulator GlxA family with amidase domain